MAMAYSFLTYVFVPRSLAIATQSFASKHDLQISGGNWSISWFNSKITNQGLTLYGKGFAPPVFDIGKASLRYGLRDLLFDGWEKSLRSLHIVAPRISLSYDVNGKSNWESISSAKEVVKALLQEIQNSNPDKSSIFLEEVRVAGMHIDWSRQHPDFSGASVYQKNISELYIDEAELVVKNINWPFTRVRDDQSLHFEGQLAGGKITFDIQGTLDKWLRIENKDEFIPISNAAWRPKGLAHVTIEGVGADALWHIMPSNDVVVRTGKVSGKINFLIDDESKLKLSSNLILDRVGISPAKTDGLGIQIIDTNVSYASGPSQVSLSGDLSDPKFQPILLLISSSVERSITAKLDKNLRIAVAKITLSYQDGIDSESRQKLEEQRPSYVHRALGLTAGGLVAEKLSETIGTVSSAAVGAIVTEAITEENTKGKGTKVGNLFRGIFGGKKKSSD
jgi:hypothetical protein